MQHIIVLHAGESGRNDHFSAAVNGSHQHLFQNLHFCQGPAHNFRQSLGLHLKQAHSAPGKGLQMGAVAPQEIAGHIHGRIQFWIGDKVYLQPFFEEVYLSGVIGIAHPGSRPGAAQLFGGQADEHVSLIAAGNRDHQVLFADTLLFQELELGPVSRNRQHIQPVGRSGQSLFVHVHHCDVVLRPS